MDRREFKDALKTLDKTVRTCFLYIEKTIDEKIKVVWASMPTPPTTDFSILDTKFDSLQKQIDAIKKIKNDFSSLKTRLEKEHGETMTEHKRGIEQIKLRTEKYDAASGRFMIEFEITERQDRERKQIKKVLDLTDKEIFLKGLIEMKNEKIVRPMQESVKNE